MSQSLRIAPPSAHATSTSNTPGAASAPSAPGLHDTLRANLSLQHPRPASTSNAGAGPVSAPLQSAHPLEARLKNWQATQDALKMNLLRRQHGIGEPVRRGMELKVCRDGEWRPSVLGGSASVSGDVLSGRDTEITWEDVYRSDETREGPDFHTEVEGRVRMDR